MNLKTAAHYGESLINWIMPHAHPAIVAGSIRRQRPICNDVDIVCIPKTDQVRDLFGEVTRERNLLHEFLQAYVKTHPTASFQSGGDSPGKMVILQLPKCQLDLWFATPETFATRLLCRTGSREHNIWLASRAKRRGLKWNPYEGLLTGGQWHAKNDQDFYVGGTPLPTITETALYEALDLPFIDPINRELPWLVKHFGE